MDLKTISYQSFRPLVESVQDNFDTAVYDFGIKTDKREIFDKMRFFGVNPPSNTSHFFYMTLPTTFDKMLITRTFFSSKKSATPIDEVKRFLESQLDDTVCVIFPFKYAASGNEISNDIHKIKMSYCTLINFCY